jgi:hypothetical protein
VTAPSPRAGRQLCRFGWRPVGTRYSCDPPSVRQDLDLASRCAMSFKSKENNFALPEELLPPCADDSDSGREPAIKGRCWAALLGLHR